MFFARTLWVCLWGVPVCVCLSTCLPTGAREPALRMRAGAMHARDCGSELVCALGHISVTTCAVRCAPGSVQDSVCQASPGTQVLQAPAANPSCIFHPHLMLQHEPRGSSSKGALGVE